MANKGLHTFAEIMSQPLVWREALEIFQARAVGLRALWDEETFDEVIFTGCGSTYYLSLVGAALFQQLTGVQARAYPASELIFYPPYRPGRKYLLMTVSRSGTTSETVEAARLFRERAAGKVIGVGCYSESDLMQSADLALVIDSARERSIAQTRSFSSMLVAVQLIAGYLGGQGDAALLAELPVVCERLLNDYHEFAQRLGEDQRLERFFFLGSHARYGVACEAMLKLKEMSLSYSEAFHPLEFRHGPMSMVNDGTLIIGLLGDSAYHHEAAVLKDMAGRGARTLAIANEHAASWPSPISMRASVPEWGRPVLYLPVLQLMAYYRALANGQDPDRPSNLDAVVSLDNLR
jgi:glucosamine--fructose-6-phosphate aminotransferase (isomerizing)